MIDNLIVDNRNATFESTKRAALYSDYGLKNKILKFKYILLKTFFLLFL